MSDESEQIRRARLAEINAERRARDALPSACGPARDTQESMRNYEIVRYQADASQTAAACSWCHATNPAKEPICRECGHQAHVARLLCRCQKCAGGTGSQPEPLTAADLEAALERLRRRGSDA